MIRELIVQTRTIRRFKEDERLDETVLRELIDLGIAPRTCFPGRPNGISTAAVSVHSHRISAGCCRVTAGTSCSLFSPLAGPRKRSSWKKQGRTATSVTGVISSRCIMCPSGPWPILSSPLDPVQRIDFLRRNVRHSITAPSMATRSVGGDGRFA